MPTSKRKAMTLDSLTKSKEPKSTKKAIHCAVQFWMPIIKGRHPGNHQSQLFTSKSQRSSKVIMVTQEYETLIDGTLCALKTTPVTFILNARNGSSPIKAECSLPQIHTKTIIKEVKRLCGLGILGLQPSSE